MELTANIWPVIDEASGLIYRFLARAYALEASDQVISATLVALSRQDYRLASAFLVPRRFHYVTPYGTLEGCVHASLYDQYEFALTQPILSRLEEDFAKIQGVALTKSGPLGIATAPTFPESPYLVTTFLIESQDGGLTPASA